MNKVFSIAATLFVIVIVLALPAIAQQSGADATGATVTVSPKVRNMAKNPTPPANAQQKTSASTMNTKNTSDDSDSFWVQEIDVDGDGNVEKADLLWDDEDKVLYISYKDDFQCKNGSMGSGDVLIGLNGEGNARKMPAGSGFYTVSLDRSECGSHSVGLWGCRFDANGVETACGVAFLDEKNDSLIFATATQ